jgi:hypothetical protein|mmetsp:Transcript_15481/g.34658  ORF Transcript_15481/g.34658 Transcript_15481/m.34658 type:complete len:128 (+) Transcript_15481:151-534(+)
MKSSHNCLVDGTGNLFLCVMHRESSDTEPEFWLARYGKALDESLGSPDVMKINCPWDIHSKCVKGSDSETLRSLGKNSPFEGKSPKATGVNINRMSDRLRQMADEHSYDNVFYAGHRPARPAKRQGS